MRDPSAHDHRADLVQADLVQADLVQADLVRADLVRAVRDTFARARRNDRQEMRPEDPPTEPAGSDDFPEPLRPPRTDR